MYTLLDLFLSQMELLDFIQFEQILSSFFPTPLQPANFQPV